MNAAVETAIVPYEVSGNNDGSSAEAQPTIHKLIKPTKPNLLKWRIAEKISSEERVASFQVALQHYENVDMPRHQQLVKEQQRARERAAYAVQKRANERPSCTLSTASAIPLAIEMSTQLVTTPQLLLEHSTTPAASEHLMLRTLPTPPRFLPLVPPTPELVQLCEALAMSCFISSTPTLSLSLPVSSLLSSPVKLPPQLLVPAQCHMAPSLAGHHLPPIFILSLDRAKQFEFLMETYGEQYAGNVYCVLNSIYLEVSHTGMHAHTHARMDALTHNEHILTASLLNAVTVEYERAVEYLAVAEKHANMHVWLLPPGAKGVAAARSALITRIAGCGPTILMDDDAKAFAVSVGSSRTRLTGRRITLGAVVERLVAGHLLHNTKLVGVQHWYHHAAGPGDLHAVKRGLQHLTFSPLLVDLPSPLPPGLTLKYDTMEDDELCYRIATVYGPMAILKLRYIISKFDVGDMGGGLQTEGMAAGRARQTAMSKAAMEEFGEDDFFWAKSFGTGRLAAPRIRMKVDQKSLVCQTVDDQPAAQVIEQYSDQRQSKQETCRA